MSDFLDPSYSLLADGERSYSATHGTSSLLWMVILGGFVAFCMAYWIGANAFGTSVGSKAITLKQAVVIAAIFEFAGAFFLGSQVTDTVRKKIVDNDKFEKYPDILLLGFFCSLISASVILFVVTKFSLPVSTTQTMVGSIIGFTMVAKGPNAVDWTQVRDIIIFWIGTPLMGGIAAAFFFIVLRTFWLHRRNSVEKVYKSWGLFAMVVGFIMSYFMLMKGLNRFSFSDKITLANATWISICIGIVSGGLLWFAAYKSNFLYKHMFLSNDLNNTYMIKISVAASISHSHIPLTTSISDYGTNKTPIDEEGGKKDKPDTIIENEDKVFDESSMPEHSVIKERKKKLKNLLLTGVETDVHSGLDDLELTMMKNCEKFSVKIERGFQYLQVLTASLDILAHGSNDVANAIAPFATMVALYQNPKIKDDVNVDWWILLLGGIGMVVGLGTYGYKVIKSIGVRLIPMSCTRGYCIELGSALVVILASWYGYPTSTTHAQVGATVGVGLVEVCRPNSKLTISQVVNWKLMAKVFISWIFALTGGALFCALIFSFLAYSPSL